MKDERHVNCSSNHLSGDWSRGAYAILRKRKAKEARLVKTAPSPAQTKNNRGLAQEKAQALRDELKRALSLREVELQDDEEQLAQQQQTIDRRVAVLKERDERLAAQFANIKQKKEEVGLLREELEHVDKLVISEAEKVAGARCDQLLEHLSIELTDEARVAAQRAASIWIDQAKNRNEVEAKRIMDVACHRYGVPCQQNVCTLLSMSRARQSARKCSKRIISPYWKHSPN